MSCWHLLQSPCQLIGFRYYQSVPASWAQERIQDIYIYVRRCFNMSTTTKLAWRGNYQSLRHHHGRGAQFNKVRGVCWLLSSVLIAKLSLVSYIGADCRWNLRVLNVCMVFRLKWDGQRVWWCDDEHVNLFNLVMMRPEGHCSKIIMSCQLDSSV